MTLWLVLTLAERGSGHRVEGPTMATIEANGAVEKFENEPHVVPHDDITPVEQNRTGPRVSLFPATRPIPARGVPPKPIALTTSSFIDFVHHPMSVLVSNHTEAVHGSEVPQLRAKSMLYTYTVFGFLLLFWCCCCCGMDAQGADDSFTAQSSTASGLNAVSHVSNLQSMAGPSGARSAPLFKRIRKMFSAFDPRHDEDAAGDRETPEDRMAQIILKRPPSQ